MNMLSSGGDSVANALVVCLLPFLRKLDTTSQSWLLLTSNQDVIGYRCVCLLRAPLSALLHGYRPVAFKFYRRPTCACVTSAVCTSEAVERCAG